VLARARALERSGRDVVHLEIGQPDFPTPRHIRDAAIDALNAGHTGYSPTPGIPELREAIAEHASGLRGIAVGPERIIVTPGAKPLLFYAVNALAGAGDEVIYPDPGFPMYRSLIEHAGARPVPIRLREENAFRFDIDEFRRLVSDRTRLVILNSPENPTGGVLSRSDLEAVAAEARSRGFYVLSDEVYLHFAYDEPFTSVASLPGMLDRTIIVDGFSKTWAMTGWRLGWGVVPPELFATFELYNVNIVSCACTFGQHGAIAAIRGPWEPVEEMIAEFRRRRDFLVDALNALPGVSCVRPRGAFYAFPNITGTGLAADELSRRLLDEAGVATLPGTAFGPAGAGYLRLSYASAFERLEAAVERMGRFLASSS